ncbi:MAG: glycosyltransferase family 2 protein [Bacteroidales bacterium]|nr:glycosyltransferase family 2 protein [Bacteroidales bacterium]
MKKVSILIPCRNEEQVLPLLVERLDLLIESSTNYQWEILFVNDGSTDSTLNLIKSYREKKNYIRYIDLSRNFGKEIAMMAGLDFVEADAVVIMDADLQHPPEIIPELLQFWEEGYDDVAAQRKSLADATLFKNISSKVFHAILSRVSKTPIQEHVGDFRLLDRVCIDAMCQIRDAQRYTKGLYSWIGFKKKIVMYDEPLRSHGKGKFGFNQLMDLAIEGITSFTIAPLRLSLFLGVFFLVLSFGFLFFGNSFNIEWLAQTQPIVLFAIVFMGGIQLLTIGILGEYLGRMFYEAKPRPPYLIREKV